MSDGRAGPSRNHNVPTKGTFLWMLQRHALATVNGIQIQK
jgi:hypothetical protein